MTTDAPAIPEPRLSALNLVGHPDRGSQIGVLAKRTYLVVGGRCQVADEQVALVEEPQVNEDTTGLVHDTDLALNRELVDVVVDGKAHALRPSGRLEVRVRVGALDRRVVAFGTRRVWRDAAGRLRFGEPEPFESVDLGWASAYGGADLGAVQRHGDPVKDFCEQQRETYDPRFGRFGYPRNQAGRGYLIDATVEALDRCSLPNLEEPSTLLTPERLAIGDPARWPSAPLPAALGWLSYGAFALGSWP